MQKTINALRKNSAYVSIETVIVAGLIIGLGAIIIIKLSNSATTISETGVTNISNVSKDFETIANKAK